jgi:hypothetical protein
MSPEVVWRIQEAVGCGSRLYRDDIFVDRDRGKAHYETFNQTGTCNTVVALGFNINRIVRLLQSHVSLF